MKKTTIVIAGIGGVGAYFGGLLADYYSSSDEVSICFFARGENEIRIREQGLKMETAEGTRVVMPSKISSNAADFEAADFILLCTKTYGLPETLKTLSTCVKSTTIFLPLLNGIDSHEVIKIHYPKHEIWDGCAYLVSALISPGYVKNMGIKSTLFFGSPNGEVSKLKAFESLLKAAHIDARYSNEIELTVWEKYLFISAVASATSYFNCSVGLILAEPKSKAFLSALLLESKMVADASGIVLKNDIVDTTLSKISALPPDTTSSMQRDFAAGKLTEVESLTGAIVRLAKKSNVEVPAFELAYAALVK